MRAANGALLSRRRRPDRSIREFALKEGNPANLVVLTQPNVWKALWEHEAPAYVIKNGKDITLRD